MLICSANSPVSLLQSGTNHRLAAVVERHLPFPSGPTICRNAYFEQKNFLSWTLKMMGAIRPATRTRTKNPFAQITFQVRQSQPSIRNAVQQSAP